MLFDLPLIDKVYRQLPPKVDKARHLLQRPLTLSEKILYGHLWVTQADHVFIRGRDYVDFAPDRVAMQDATAQMALLQFMNAGRDKTAVATTVYCDHLIQAYAGAAGDLERALEQNKEVYDFLQSISNKYGIGFWRPGAGIIHQVVLENYAFPGGMMIGTDSHTVNAGGLGMIAIGVGGADAVDVMAGMPWELKMPEIIGVRLTGKPSGWTAPKDVILKVAGILTVKGGTGRIIEYFGEGTQYLSATGKGTICNMGAEVGATTSIFAYDDTMGRYLTATGREEVARRADAIGSYLKADEEVYRDPQNYFDRLIDIDLSTLEPHINGPYTPDAAYPISEFVIMVKEKDYPLNIEVGLIGSCTNSSYEDLTRAASVARQAKAKGLEVKTEFIVTPGSEQIRYTTQRDGLLKAFEEIGGVVMANACGPCIGQWKRVMDDPERRNSIITSFNRNFAKRNDGYAATHSFVASPEIVTAMTIAGRLTFNPLTDTMRNVAGEEVRLDEPQGEELPARGFEVKDPGYIAPSTDGSAINVVIHPGSQRLQRLEPFPAWDGHDMKGLNLLIKVTGKCTTDHISMAGPWLRFRGHLDNISDNLLMGAVNFFNGQSNLVKNLSSGEYDKVSSVARFYKQNHIMSVVIGDENYGEGSSREHAAMEPRHLGVAAIIARSFARIHETNLKKQGMLALTFADKNDYDRIREEDRIDITGLTDFAPDRPLTVMLHHRDATSESFSIIHSYNEAQIEWFRAGSALNLIRSRLSGGK